MAKRAQLTLISGDSGEVSTLPTKRKERVIRPKNSKQALAACSALYVKAARGEIDTGDASRLAFVLRTCSSLHEEAEIQPRLEALEARLEQLLEMRNR